MRTFAFYTAMMMVIAYCFHRTELDNKKYGILQVISKREQNYEYAPAFCVTTQLDKENAIIRLVSRISLSDCTETIIINIYFFSQKRYYDSPLKTETAVARIAESASISTSKSTKSVSIS